MVIEAIVRCCRICVDIWEIREDNVAERRVVREIIIMERVGFYKAKMRVLRLRRNYSITQILDLTVSTCRYVKLKKKNLLPNGMTSGRMGTSPLPSPTTLEIEETEKQLEDC